MTEESLGDLVGLFNSNLTSLDAFLNPSSQGAFHSLNEALTIHSREYEELNETRDAFLEEINEKKEKLEKEIQSLEKKRRDDETKLSSLNKLYLPIQEEMKSLDEQRANLEEIKSIAERFVNFEALEAELSVSKSLKIEQLKDFFEKIVVLLRPQQFKVLKNVSRFEEVSKVIKTRIATQLRGKVEGAVRERLKAIEWPKPIETSKSLSESKINDFLSLFTSLVRLQRLVEDLAKFDESGFPPQLWALDLLFADLSLRFTFHFMSNQSTNNIEKPEWFLAYVLTLLKDHAKFFDILQSVLDDERMSFYDVRNEFLRHFIPKINGKVKADLPKFEERPEIFWKWINESVSFSRAIKRMTGFNSEYYSVFQHFFEEANFTKWLQIEVDLTQRYLLSILTDEEAWKPYLVVDERYAMEAEIELQRTLSKQNRFVPNISVDSRLDSFVVTDSDPFKPPKAVVKLISLLSTIEDRYRMFPSLNARVSFLEEVQAPLIREFYENVKELASRLDDSSLFANSVAIGAKIINNAAPVISQPIITSNSDFDLPKYCALINSCHYTIKTLTEWNEKLFYLELNEHKAKIILEERKKAKSRSRYDSETESLSDNESTETVFETEILSVTSLRDKLLSKLFSIITNWITNSLRPYFKKNKNDWIVVDRKFDTDFPISDELCDTVLLMTEILRKLRQSLASDLFQRIVSGVAVSINEQILTNVIFENFYSDYGAKQLEVDVKHLESLFAFHSDKPRKLILPLHEAQTLLNLNHESIGNLREKLGAIVRSLSSTNGSAIAAASANLNKEKAVGFLKLFGVKALNYDQVNSLMQRRILQ